MQINQALEIFMYGEIGIPSTENRSQRHVIDGLSILHVDDVWNQEPHVADEVIVQNHSPAAVLAMLANYQPTADHRITLVDRPASDHVAYNAAGYRHSSNEVLLVRKLSDLPPLDQRYSVGQAKTIAEMQWLNSNDPANRVWISETRLHESGLRHSFISLEQRVVARVRACRIDAEHSYVMNLYTASDYRRRGIARALMIHVLHEAAAHGEQWSVLVASEAGLALYQALGYEQRASLVVFEPIAEPNN